MHVKFETPVKLSATSDQASMAAAFLPRLAAQTNKQTSTRAADNCSCAIELIYILYFDCSFFFFPPFPATPMPFVWIIQIAHCQGLFWVVYFSVYNLTDLAKDSLVKMSNFNQQLDHYYLGLRSVSCEI